MGYREFPGRPRVAPNRCIDCPFRWNHLALNKRMVFLDDFPFFEFPFHDGIRNLTLRDNHESGCADIEPVHDPLTFRWARRRDSIARTGECPQNSVTLPTQRGVCREERWFAHNDDVVVVIDDLHVRNENRDYLGFARIVPDNRQHDVWGQSIGLSRHPTVHLDPTAFHHVTRKGARETQKFRDGDVDPLPDEAVRYGK